MSIFSNLQISVLKEMGLETPFLLDRNITKKHNIPKHIFRDIKKELSIENPNSYQSRQQKIKDYFSSNNIKETATKDKENPLRKLLKIEDNTQQRLKTNNIVSLFEYDNISWEKLQKNIESCQKCSLHNGSTKPITGTGNKSAPIFFVRPSPDKDENNNLKSITSKSKLLLSSILNEINIDLADIYLTNIIKCQQKMDVDATESELKQCREHLTQQISIVNPKLIILEGQQTAQAFLNSQESIYHLMQKTNFKLSFEGGKEIPIILIPSLKYLLKVPKEKIKVWEKLKNIKSYLN